MTLSGVGEDATLSRDGGWYGCGMTAWCGMDRGTVVFSLV